MDTICDLYYKSKLKVRKLGVLAASIQGYFLTPCYRHVTIFFCNSEDGQSNKRHKGMPASLLRTDG